MNLSFLRPAAAALAVALLIAGCDLSGLESAGDDFDLIIELEEIETVVGGQVYDLSTFEPIPNVVLQFSGQDAGSLIDVYSDPISSETASSGFITFGVNNALSPTEANPVEFEVTAIADGYISETAAVFITGEGANSFALGLMPDDVTTPVTGTSGISSSSGVANAETGLASHVTVTTPQQSEVEAEAQMSLAEGSKPLGADGAPLSGPLTVDMRIFDLNEGFDAIPATLLPADENDFLLGLTTFSLTDASGRAALDFSSTTSACGFEMVQTIRDEDLYDLVAAGTVTEVDVDVVSPETGESVTVGAIPLTLGAAPEVVATICAGGTNANVDMAPVRQAASATGKVGAIKKRYSWRVRKSFRDVSTLRQIVVHNPSNASLSQDFKVRYKGKTGYRKRATSKARGTVDIPGSGSATIATDLKVMPGSRGVIKFRGDHRGTYRLPKAPSGSFDAEVTLEGIADVSARKVTAALSCGSNQKFEPQLTEKSFSALKIYYRPAGEKVEFSDGGSIQDISTTPNSVSASVSAALEDNSSYEFKAVFKGKSSTKTVTTGTGDLVIDDLDVSDIGGLDCVSI